MVKLEVAMLVVPTSSTATKPTVCSNAIRSRTGIAPLIQSDQASRLQTLAGELFLQNHVSDL
jgi:hypothetical protein